MMQACVADGFVDYQISRTVSEKGSTSLFRNFISSRNGQLGIVWIFPFVEAAFILHIVFQHFPDVVLEKWIPWPLKGLVLGKDHPSNCNRNDDEGAAVNGSDRQGRDIESAGGGDVVGSD